MHRIDYQYKTKNIMEDNIKSNSFPETKGFPENRETKEPKKSQYSPWAIYKQLGQQNRQHFWAVSVSVFISILSIWIGVTFQLVAIEENSAEQIKVEHAQVVNSLMPFKDKYISSQDSLLSYLKSIESDTTKKVAICSTQTTRVLDWAEECLRIGEESKFYLKEEDCQRISDNDCMAIIALPALRELSDTIVNERFNYDFYIWKFILRNSDRIKVDSNINNQVPHGHLANVQNFKQELKDIFDVSKELSTKRDSLFSIAKQQINTSPDYLSLSDTIKCKKTNMLYKYIIYSLYDNYEIINFYIQPLKENRIHIIPKSKEDFYKLWTSIKDVGLSSNFGSTIFSLSAFILIGFFIWYLILLIIFKKGEYVAQKEDAEWKDPNSLQQQIIEKRKMILKNWNNL